MAEAASFAGVSLAGRFCMVASLTQVRSATASTLTFHSNVTNLPVNPGGQRQVYVRTPSTHVALLRQA